jgi:uncharacterized protein (TIGR02466 family)
MALHNELWFPSVIWSGIVHRINNANLKNYAYVRKESDKGVVVSNQGGWQSNSIRSGESADVDSLVEYLNQEIHEICKQTGLPKLELYNIWININRPGSYNLLHNHVGAVLSGVYYIHAEEGQGNIQFERNDNAEYHIPARVDNYTYFTATKASYKSKTSAVYIFPSWLKHNVEANTSNEDRISISFNYGVANAS